MGEDGPDGPSIRVVRGAATGPTAVAAYDAALYAANVHDYNLATVSSVVPPAATVESVGTAPDLGPRGGRLWTVQARATAEGPGRVSAALGWATDDAGGVFYEAAGEAVESAVREEVSQGLAAARRLRERDLADERVESTTLEVTDSRYLAAVVLAVYGRAEPMG